MNMNCQATHISAMESKNSQVMFVASNLKFMTLISSLNMLVSLHFVLLQSDLALN